jgi:hypothetical protein
MAIFDYPGRIPFTDEFNDIFRKNPPRDQLILSDAVQTYSPEKFARVLAAIRDYEFTDENDLMGTKEHIDVEVEGVWHTANIYYTPPGIPFDLKYTKNMSMRRMSIYAIWELYPND